MTPGQLALIEAARMEAARVYGRVYPDHQEPVGLSALVAEAEIAELQRGGDKIERAILDGQPNSQIIAEHGVDYATVRAARKRVMRDGAA